VVNVCFLLQAALDFLVLVPLDEGDESIVELVLAFAGDLFFLFFLGILALDQPHLLFLGWLHLHHYSTSKAFPLKA
jgi:hypothetical protein